MPVKARAQSVTEGEQNQRDHRRGQHRMGNQDREIKRPDPALSGKMHRAHVGVVIEIAGQEDAGGDYGGDHAGASRRQ